MKAATFLYINYGPSPLIGRELAYSLATLRAEIPDAQVVVYTDKPAPPGVTARPYDPAWTRGGLLNHRAKLCALLDALQRDGGLCVLLDTDSYINPGFTVLKAPAMDHFETRDPLPECGGFQTTLPHSGTYSYDPKHSHMFNSGLVATDNQAAIEDALALADALLDAGQSSFKIEQFAFSEALRRHGPIHEGRPAFQHYYRRSLKRYMHWRIAAWLKRTGGAPTRPCIKHPRNAVRLYNLVTRLGGRG